MSEFSPEQLDKLSSIDPLFNSSTAIERLAEFAGDDFEHMLELAPTIIDVLTSPPQGKTSPPLSESKITEMNDILENTIR